MAECIVGRLQPPGDRVVPRGEPICIEIVQRTCDFHQDGRSHDHWHVVTHYVGGRTEAILHYYDHAGAACETATVFGTEHGMGWDREAFPNGLVR